MFALLLAISTERSGPAAIGGLDTAKQPPPAWLEAPGGCRIRLAPRQAIGRSRKCELVVPSKCISRRHALIEVRGNGDYWLSDLGSRNGTCVNGRRIARAVRLRDGDRVRIADTAFRFLQPPPAASIPPGRVAPLR